MLYVLASMFGTWVLWAIAVKLDRRRCARGAELEKIARANAQPNNSAAALRNAAEPGDWYDLVGPGRYDIHVAGSSHYRDALLAICGGTRTESGRHRKITAALVYEPENAYDDNAVRVEIDDMTVGYLPKEAALAFHHAT